MPRQTPISGSSNFLAQPYNFALTDRERNLLWDARENGIIRGVTLLSKMTCDVETIIWGGLKSAATIGTSAATSPKYAKIANLLSWAFGKAVVQISQNVWFQRFTKILDIGISAALQFAEKVLLDPRMIGSLLPFYNAISDLKNSVLNVYDMLSANTSLNRIVDAAPQIGSGIPTVMFERFKDYLSNEIVYNLGKAHWNFGKALTQVLVAIFAAPAMSLVGLVTQVVQAVTSFVFMVCQGWAFRGATNKCREWIQNGDINAKLDFSEGIAGCPFIGCVFFGAANYIGHFNLTSLLTRDTLTSGNLSLAVSEVSAVQREACKYVRDTKVPFKFIDSRDKWLLNMMHGMADTAPRSEFVNSDASMKVKFMHYGKLGVGKFQRTFGSVFRKL